MKAGDKITWKWPPESKGVPVEVVSDDEDGWWFIKLASANVWYRAHARELVASVSASEKP